MKKRAIMVVMNALHTDARVQRAADALATEFDLTVIGINRECDGKKYKQDIIDDEVSNGILRYLIFQREVKKKLRCESMDLFYAHDYFSARLVPWVKRHMPKAKVVYDSHELIIPEEGKHQSKRNQFFYYGEKKALKHADLIISASNARSQIMKKHYDMPKEPVHIDNISELPDISDDYSNKLLTKHEDFFEKGGITLVYAGVLYPGRRIDQLINIVGSLEKAKLLIIGDGPDMEHLKDASAKIAPDRVRFTGSLPYRYLSVLLKKCDIGFISYSTDTLNNKYCAPNKIYEYSSVELPMIATGNPTIQDFFDKYGIGCINTDLREAFLTVANDVETYKENCRNFTAENTWQAQANNLVAEIEKLFN